MMRVLFIIITLTAIGATARAETFTFDLACGQENTTGTLDIDLNFSSWEKEIVVIDRASGRPTWQLTSPAATLKIGTDQSQSARLFSDTGIGSQISIESQAEQVSDFMDFYDGHFKERGTFVLLADLTAPEPNGSRLVLLFKKGKPAELETIVNGETLCWGRTADTAAK